MTEEIQPTTINAISGTIDKPYALLAGLQLDLFTALEDGPLTVDELARVVQGDAQRLSGLVYFLVGAGLLTVSDGRFANTPEADRWLVRGRPGSYVNYEGFRSGLYRAYSKIAESIRAGHALANHDYTTMSPDELRVSYGAFDQGARALGEWYANTFDFSTCRTLVDVGGGSGGFAVALTERHPQVHATVADLPSVVIITAQFVAEAGAADRVQTLGLDLRVAPLPGQYDTAVLSNFVQVFERDEARQVLRHVGAAVRPGGILYITGCLLDETRLGPDVGLWFNFAAIGYYERGQAYTESEYRTWLEDAGFGEVEFRWGEPSGQGATIVAHKRS